MAKKKTEFQKLREVREKITNEKIQKALQGASKSQTQVGDKEGSFSYETGQFE